MSARKLTALSITVNWNHRYKNISFKIKNTKKHVSYEFNNKLRKYEKNNSLYC